MFKSPYHYKDFSLSLNLHMNKVEKITNMKKVEGRGSERLYLAGYVLDTNMAFVEEEQFFDDLYSSYNSLQKYNGTFCGVLIKKDEVTIFSDRMTTMKCYFAVQRNILYLSCDVERVVKLSPCMPERDEASLAEMLFRGNMSPNKTHYKGISTLAIGEVASVASGSNKFRFYKYDTIFGEGVIDKRPIEEVAEDIVEDLTNCISNSYRYHRKYLGATLSGGRDSRMLVGIAKKQGIEFPMITIDTCGPVDEYDVMKPLLDYWKAKSHNYPYQEGYFQRYAKTTWQNAGFMTNMHTWFAPAMKDRKNLRRLYITGMCVDNMIDDNNYGLKNFIDGSFPMDIDEVVDKIVSGATDVGALLSHEFMEHLTALYRARLKEVVVPFMQSPRGVKDFYIQTRGVNDVLLICHMFRSRFASFSPFLCNNVIDKVLMLDTAHCGEKMYELLFENIDKELSLIPSTRQKEPLPYAKVREFNYKPMIDWAYEQLKDGYMMRNHFIDSGKMESYFKARKEANRALGAESIAILAMNCALESR